MNNVTVIMAFILFGTHRMPLNLFLWGVAGVEMQDRVLDYAFV